MNDQRGIHWDRGGERAERLITERLTGLIMDTLGAEVTADLRALQIELTDALLDEEIGGQWTGGLLHEFTQSVSALFHCEVLVAADPVIESQGRRPLVIATNHLGIGKTGKYCLWDLGGAGARVWREEGHRHLFPNDEPFMARRAALDWAIQEVSGAHNCVEVQMFYPPAGRVLQRRFNVAGLWLDGRESLEALVERIDTAWARPQWGGKRDFVIIYPEGGTTGKRSREGDPLVLEVFKSGFIEIARRLGAGILPVVQVPTVRGSVVVSLMEPVDPWTAGAGDANRLAEELRVAMQGEIDRLRFG